MVKILAATWTILSHVHYGFPQFFQTNGQMPGLYFDLGQSFSMNIITEYHLLFDSTQPKLLTVQLVNYIAFVPMPTYVSSQSQCLHESVN